VEPTQGKPQSFYRWVGADGRLHVVSSLESVPVAERGKVSVVTLHADESSLPSSLVNGAAWRPDWISFAVGFGVALVLAVLFKLLPNGLRFASRVVLVLGVGALLSGLYLSLVRSSSGVQGVGPLTSPSALIQDAKGAVEQMNLRQKQQEEELRKIQAEH
jgi:CHASE2 domain-containing sensor protein